jgi:uroporphyrinogen-III synthase/uroporphyrinogen III methyltransferase/synthase
VGAPSATARLDGRTVVVTRGKGDSDALADRLRALGAAVRELPSIAIGAPESWGPLDAALRDLGRFDWVVFASANCVEKTLERMGSLGVPDAALAARKLAVVGPATAERLARALRPPDLVPAEAKGEALARELAPMVRGRRVLLPRAADGRPELPQGLAAAGALLEAPDAYRTVAAPPEALAPLSGWIARGEVDAVAFASPSAVKAVAAALGDGRSAMRGVLLAAIGPTTAAALRDAGLDAGAVPSEYSASALADAIAHRLGPAPGRR